MKLSLLDFKPGDRIKSLSGTLGTVIPTPAFSDGKFVWVIFDGQTSAQGVHDDECHALELVAHANYESALAHNEDLKTYENRTD